MPVNDIGLRRVVRLVALLNLGYFGIDTNGAAMRLLLGDGVSLR